MPDDHMSQVDAITRAIFDALNDRDWEALANLVDPDFEFYSAFADMGESVYRGVDGFAELIADFDETWEDMSWAVEDVREAAEHTIHSFKITGRARRSGVPLDERGWQVVEWRGRRPHRVKSYFDRAEALAAAGLED
jgi:ketosteroid isomerase-like protein